MTVMTGQVSWETINPFPGSLTNTPIRLRGADWFRELVRRYREGPWTDAPSLVSARVLPAHNAHGRHNREIQLRVVEVQSAWLHVSFDRTDDDGVWVLDAHLVDRPGRVEAVWGPYSYHAAPTPEQIEQAIEVAIAATRFDADPCLATRTERGHPMASFFQMADFPACPDCKAQDWHRIIEGQLHDYDDATGEWSLASIPTWEDVDEDAFVCRNCDTWIYEETNTRLFHKLINRGGCTL
jgi:hypothetical protein